MPAPSTSLHNHLAYHLNYWTEEDKGAEGKGEGGRRKRKEEE